MDPIAQNIAGVQSLVGSKLNKLGFVTDHDEGVQGEFIDELELDLSDEELLALKRKVEANYRGYEAVIKQRQAANKTYYLGKQKGGTSEATDGMVAADNLIFESNETFIPAALAKNPEPVVFADDTLEGDALSNDVKCMLQYHTEILSLRAQLNLMVRKHSVDLLAVMKHGWDKEIEDITDDVRDVKNFIFDSEGYIDVFGNYVGTMGEQIPSTGQELIDTFPKWKEYITVMCDGKLGTKVVRTEWWNDKYTFTTFKEKILEKTKNPHYNYDKKVFTQDLDGNQIEDVEPGNNHFARPKKPYTFLSVFTFGEEPYDVTGLIEQNIPNQRRISRRTEQIDFNLSRNNNTDVFSETNFNQETAKQAKNALIKGNPILVPAGGPISEAIVRLPAQGVDGSFFKDLDNQKAALRASFGIEGITANKDAKEETARGMILNNQHDTSRIGGSMGDALERVAKAIFNQHVQFYYVYYDVPHAASIMGQMKAVQYATLSASKLNKKLVVSVSPDSMKPHDEITEMNQAMSLYEAGALDPKTLLTRVNFPDPQNTAEQTVLWLLDKNAYMQLNFPQVAQQVQAMQQQMMAQQQQQAQAQQEQQIGQQQAQNDQQLSQSDQAHQQKITQQEQAHIQKMKQADEQAKQKLSINQAGASLKSVPLPK